MMGFGVSTVGPSGSATIDRYSVMWILGTWVVRVGGGYSWRRILFRGSLWY
jgi:hypothetical protein